MRRFSGVIAMLCMLGLLAACNFNKEPELYGTDITGASFANTLSLTDHTGKPRTLEDFKGKIVVLFRLHAMPGCLPDDDVGPGAGHETTRAAE
jgi:protein SCO1/2